MVDGEQEVNDAVTTRLTPATMSLTGPIGPSSTRCSIRPPLLDRDSAALDSDSEAIEDPNSRGDRKSDGVESRTRSGRDTSKSSARQ